MMKTALVTLLVLGSISMAEAMPAAPLSTGASMPIVKAAVVIKKKVVVKKRVVRPRHRRVVKKVIIK